MKRFLPGLALAVFAGGACSDDAAEKFAGPIIYDDFPETAAGADRSDDLGIAHAFVLSAGFANGAAVQYLDQGELNPTPAKVYLLMKGGAPVDGQFAIVDTLPDDAEYSPFWQIVEVEVGGGYKANDIKSLKGLADAGFKMTETLEALHCPIVNPDATWFAADLSQTFTVFYGTGEPVPNPFFDPSAEIDDVNKPTLTDEDATAGDIMLTPFWQKRMRGFCWSDDITRRYPLLDEEGTISLDLDEAQMRFDTYSVAFGPGGELGAEASNDLPVFEHTIGEAGYSPVVLQAFVASPGSQPASVADFDPDEVAAAEPEALLDNPIVFPLALDRFLVTIENTTADPDGLAFGTSMLVVEDGSAPVFFEGEPVPTALFDYASIGDLAGLIAGWTVSGRPLGPIIDVQFVGGIAPGESSSAVIVASPFIGYLTMVANLEGLEGGFTGVSEVPLYNEETFSAEAEQSFDLPALIVNAEIENPDDPEAPFEGVGPAPDIEGPVGTITIELITSSGPGGTP